MEIARERLRAGIFVVEGEHAHAPRLAVAPDGKQRRLGAGRRLAQSAVDRAELACRPVAEERKRDV